MLPRDYVFISTSTGSRPQDFESLIKSFCNLNKNEFINPILYIYDQNPISNKELIKKYKSSDADIRVITSSNGIVPLSYARNQLINLIDDGIVIFSDDDATYPKNFLIDLDKDLRGISDFKLGYFKLLNMNNKSTYGNRRYPKKTGVVSRLTAISGCISLNIAISAVLLKNLDGFDERLGVGSLLSCGEETDLILRALDQRINCYFLSSPFSFHPPFIWSDVTVEKIFSYSNAYRKMLFLNKRSLSLGFILSGHFSFMVLRSLLGFFLKPREFKQRLAKLKGLLWIC